MADTARAAEAPVWDWLAAHGVPYDATVAAVVERYGYASAGPDGHPRCLVRDARDVVPGQVDPVEASVGPDSAFPPTLFYARAYDGHDPEGTYRRASRALVETLGPGRSSGGANVLGLEWAFGLAGVSLTLFPRRLNEWPRATFAWDDPLRWKATALRVVPGIVADLAPSEAALLTRVERVGAGRLPFESGPGSAPPHWRRRPPAVAEGVYVAPEGQALAVVRDRVHLISAEAVERVELWNVTPGRGGGGAYLDVVLRSDGPRPARLPLLQGYRAGDLDAVADDLAAKTGAPLDTETYPDV